MYFDFEILFVLEKIYFKKITQNGLNHFDILKTKQFVLKNILLMFCIYAQNITCLLITIKIYYFLKFVTLIRGSSKFHCALEGIFHTGSLPTWTQACILCCGHEVLQSYDLLIFHF